MNGSSPTYSGIRVGRFLVTISELCDENGSNDKKIVHFVRHAQGDVTLT